MNTMKGTGKFAANYFDFTRDHKASKGISKEDSKRIEK